MKKLIYSLSFAVAVGFAANAENVDLRAQRALPLKTDVQAIELASSSLTFERISPVKRQAKAKATSAKDFEGTYKWSGRNQLQSVVFPNSGVMTITVSDTDPNKVLIEGFDYGADPGLDATFDPATGRLYVPNQFTFLNTYYNQDVWFVNWTVANGQLDDGSPGYALMQAPEGKDYYFTLSEDGIKAGDVDPDKWNNYLYTDEELLDVCCIAVNLMPKNTGGYFWMCFGVSATTLNDFDFIEDEWQLLGNAQFADAWFGVFWETPFELEVPVYFNKSTPGTYLLYDPYGVEQEGEGETIENPYVTAGLNASDKPGFIIFDMNDFDCVVFQPMIFGMTLNYPLFGLDEDDEEGLKDYLTNVYCFNYEGAQYYVQNASKGDIIVYGIQNDMDISSFNSRSNTVSVYNALFSIGINPGMTAYWPGWDMSGYIVLPTNWEDSVDSVLGEDLNVPAAYYNLQGVRVANPEKGQLVIVKQGNTTKKMIVR